MKQSVSIFGWSTIFVSFLLILSQLLNLMISGSMDQVAALLGGYPGLRTTALGPVMDMFAYNRIWSIYSIFYFLVTFAGGIQFIRFRESGRKILEIASWIGLVNACVDTTVSYNFWKRMETSLSGLAGGTGISVDQMSPLGLGAIIAGFFLWIIPSIGIIIYLRRPLLKSLMVPGTSRVEQAISPAKGGNEKSVRPPI